MGDYLIAELRKLPNIKEVRGRGLMIGIELFEDAAPLRKKLIYDEHIFVGSSGNKNVFRLLPALNITQAHADQVAHLVAQVIDSLIPGTGKRIVRNRSVWRFSSL